MANQNPERNPVELLAEEFLERCRQGEHPALSEYTERHVEHAEEIRELFPFLMELEGIAAEEADVAATMQSAGDAPHPPQIGDYRIIREVGRGGMGVVYEAQQESLARRVALKILPTHATNDEVALERFRREARAAAKLHHTNIVPVFDVGQAGPTCFYALQLIPGAAFARRHPTAEAGGRGEGASRLALDHIRRQAVARRYNDRST